MQLKDLVVFWRILLLKASHLREIDNNLEEYQQAPTLIVKNRSTAQPLSSMTLAIGVYLFNFLECQLAISSFQGQVNSNRTALFEDFENKRISGCDSVSANSNGNK